MKAHGRQDCLAVDARVCSVSPDGFIELELDDGGACAACAGTCTWRRAGAPRRVRFRSTVELGAGDAVRVSLPAGHIVSSALLLHGVPLGALLGGGWLGWALAHSDAGTAAGALIGLAGALLATRGLLRRAERLTVERARLEIRP